MSGHPLSNMMPKKILKPTGTLIAWVVVTLSLAAISNISYADNPSANYKFEYNANGDVIKFTNGLNNAISYRYDEFRRLIEKGHFFPANSNEDFRNTHFYYDGQDHLIKVAVNSPATIYNIDGLGNQLGINSPDAGNSTFTVDLAGNTLSKLDAKGQLTSYTYDVLNRLTRISYSDGGVVNYTYDQGANSKGRLTQITDTSGSIQYAYDGRGRVLSETRTTSTSTSATQYQYDNFGRLSNLTYPNGRRVSYTRDTLGRITQIDTSKDGQTMTVLSQVSYRPFGGVQSYNNSVGQFVAKNFDLDGRVSSYTLNNKVQAISYDAASRITAISEVNNPARQATYAYDLQNQVAGYLTPQISQTIKFDSGSDQGSIRSKTTGTATTTYNYDPFSNRLAQVIASQSTNIVTDANGSITNNGTNQFSYDARGRMVSVNTSAGVMQYQINALGQRVQKALFIGGSTPLTSTTYYYDLGGKLISEHTDRSDIDYIYLEGIPVAVLQ